MVAGLSFVGLSLATPAHAQTDWTTFGFGPQHMGYNPNETVLSVQNVSTLGTKWTRDVGGPILTQPTFLSKVTTSAGQIDLVYVATLYGDVYALNAGSGATVWHKALGAVQTGCNDFSAAGDNVGVLDTATIDRAHNRLFVVSGDGKLHALNIATGSELAGYPLQVVDSGNAGRLFSYGSPTYDASQSLLYVALASACDFTPYHGEVVQVATATTPSVTHRFFVTGQNGPSGGGIWGPGGVSLSPDGSLIYALTGNALTTPENPPYADSLVRLTRTLSVSASNTPPLSGSDVDFGATPLLYQPIGCPVSLAAMNKTGALLIYNRGSINSGPTQRIQITGTDSLSEGDFIGVPAFDPGRNRMFLGSPSDAASTYKHGLIALKISSTCVASLAWQAQVGLNNVSYNNPAIPPTVANGVVYFADGDDSKLFAFNADTGQQLWNSGSLVNGGIFAAPTVVNGRVYVSGYTTHMVYALGLNGTPVPK